MALKAQSTLGLIIAERTFDAGRDATPVVLRIGAPRPHPKRDWSCPYQIVGIGSEAVREGVGVDALQALMLCVEMARADLEARSRGDGLRWLGDSSLGLTWRDLPTPILTPPPAPEPEVAPAAAAPEKTPPPAPVERITKAAERPARPAKPAKKPKIAVVNTVTPDAALRAVVGDGPMLRKDVTKKFWAYVKRHGLQDRLNRRAINVDEKLRAVFGGQSQVAMSDVEKLIDKHVK